MNRFQPLKHRAPSVRLFPAGWVEEHEAQQSRSSGANRAPVPFSPGIPKERSLLFAVELEGGELKAGPERSRRGSAVVYVLAVASIFYIDAFCRSLTTFGAQSFQSTN
jgi:hypothetical protein